MIPLEGSTPRRLIGCAVLPIKNLYRQFTSVNGKIILISLCLNKSAKKEGRIKKYLNIFNFIPNNFFASLHIVFRFQIPDPPTLPARSIG
jgi:hypothetical protein